MKFISRKLDSRLCSILNGRKTSDLSWIKTNLSRKFHHRPTFGFAHLVSRSLEGLLISGRRVNLEVLRPAVESPVSFVDERGPVPFLARVGHRLQRVIQPTIVVATSGPGESIGQPVDALNKCDGDKEPRELGDMLRERTKNVQQC